MKLLDDYLTLSKRERHGLIWLMCILGAVITVKSVLANRELPPIDLSGDQAKVDEFFAGFETQEEEKAWSLENGTHDRAAPVPTYFMFDPNTIGHSEWQRLGLSSKQADVVLNYCNAGGVFRKASDLQKLYCISPETYAALEPWVRIVMESESATQSSSSEREKVETKVKATLAVELNLADTIALKSLTGIGSFYARKIVELREELGGFYSYDQLLDIWKMDEARLGVIRTEATVDASLIRSLDVNKSTKEELGAHPYISWSVANSIVKMREQHGRFKQVEDILGSALIDRQLFEKLRPYLRCDD
jgi:competence protein ComEA